MNKYYERSGIEEAGMLIPASAVVRSFTRIPNSFELTQR